MAAEDLIGRKIAGKFAIEALVGGGGMGAVYRARQVDLDKVVAIKVLHQSLATEPSFVTRFKREAKAASRIDHPNSMRVVDFGQEPDGLLYIAMEFLEGKNLHTIIREEAPLDPARIAILLRQTLAALAAAHDLQILHRDLKPENIIVLRKNDDEGNVNEIVKVCDFGIAKFTSPSLGTTSNEKLTTEGMLIGTPDYMSPEQARGLSVDVRSDLYSVGVILYEALTGKVPFPADTPLAVVLRHINDEPIKPSDINPDVDRKLEAVCLKAMAKLPEDRYATAREMRSALVFETARSNPPPPQLAPSPVRGTLVVVPSESTPNPAVAAPAVTSTPLRVPKTRAMDTLLADSTRAPRQGVSPVAVAVVALAVGVGGGVWWIRGHSHAAARGAPPAAPTTAVVPRTPQLEPIPLDTSPAIAPAVSPSFAVPPRALARPPTHDTSSLTTKTPGTPASPSAAVSPSPPLVPSVSAASGPPPSASTTPPPAPPVTTTSPNHVVIGAVLAKNIPKEEVTNGLPVASFNRCYRDGVAGQAKPLTGQARLHIDFSNTATEATFAGPAGFESIGGCISRAAQHMTVSGAGSADVDLTFKAD